MTLEEYHKLAETDLHIDGTKLDLVSSQIPKLHTKFHKFYVEESMRLRALELKRGEIKKNLWLYYYGKASAETYQKKPQPLKILRNDLQMFIEADAEYMSWEAKIEVQKAVVVYLEKICNCIHNRNFTIKNMNDFIRFTNGG